MTLCAKAMKMLRKEIDMKEIDVNLDYSNSEGLGCCLESEVKKVTYKLGNGIQDVSFTLNDKQALEFMEMQIKEIYGEDTLKDLEDKYLELSSVIEELESKIEKYEEYIDQHDRRM